MVLSLKERGEILGFTSCSKGRNREFETRWKLGAPVFLYNVQQTPSQVVFNLKASNALPLLTFSFVVTERVSASRGGLASTGALGVGFKSSLWVPSNSRYSDPSPEGYLRCSYRENPVCPDSPFISKQQWALSQLPCFACPTAGRSIRTSCCLRNFSRIRGFMSSI